jgi:hypothetical protein
MDLDTWLAALSAEIGTTDIALTDETIQTVLDVARDSAHEVERLAAPLTTFLVGVAVGRGGSLATIAAQTTALAVGTAPDAVDEAPDDN